MANGPGTELALVNGATMTLGGKNMKYIIYTIYAVTVLLFSGFARANTLMNAYHANQAESAARIYDVTVSQTLDLHVAGYVPTPCHSDPSAVIVQDSSNPQILIVRLVSAAPTMSACVFRTKDFATVVPLRQLIRASQLPLVDEASYVVKTEGYNFAIEVKGSDLKN